MKSAPLVFSLLFASACAYAGAPFAFLPGAESNDADSPARLLRKIAAGEAVCVQLENRYQPGPKQPYVEMLSRAYNKWFSYTKKAIEKSGRQEEFADLMPILNRQVEIKLEGQGCQEPDMKMYVLSEKEKDHYCGSGALACMGIYGSPMKLYFHPYKKINAWMMGGLNNLLAHELGHSLGLADQYKEGRDNASEIYHTPDIQRTIMSSASPFFGFGCDDADAFVNLLDVAVLRNSRGGAEGWRSFCRKRNYSYVNGRAVVNGKYAVDIVGEHKGVPVSIFDKKGQLVSQKLYDFPTDSVNYNVLAPFEPIQVEKDRRGRVIYEKNARGEERFCSYTYGRTSCVVVRGDQLLASFSKKSLMGKQSYFLEYRSGKNDHLIRFTRTGSRSGDLTYFGNKTVKSYTVSRRGKLSQWEPKGKQKLVLPVSRLTDRVTQEKEKAFQQHLTEIYKKYFK